MSLSRHDEKGTLFIIFKVFYSFQPCERMRKHVFAGRNTQHPNDYNKQNVQCSVLMSWLGLRESDNIKRLLLY